LSWFIPWLGDLASDIERVIGFCTEGCVAVLRGFLDTCQVSLGGGSLFMLQTDEADTPTKHGLPAEVIPFKNYRNGAIKWE
jgi:hypothetical protein